MKIVILDGYTANPGDLSWERIEQYGDLTVYDRTSLTDENEIQQRIGDAQIIFTNKTPLSKATIEKASNLKFISSIATGYNGVDIIAAKDRGIPVSNIPTYGTASVGQFTIALLLEICSHVGIHNDAVHAGRWITSPDVCFWDRPLIELADKTIGLIGCGRIGQAAGKIAKAMDMHVIAFDEYPTEAGKAIAEHVSLDELYERSDVVSLHCPITDTNHGMINKDSIARMKDNVIIINTSRGGLINEQDLTDALDSGKVLAAGLDVVAVEPMKEDNPLLKAKNCIITPHIAWSPKESRQRLVNIAADNLKAFIDGNPINVVNS